jgi:hypothetical protein
MYNDRTTIRKEHKIVIIGDGHSRGYAGEVKNHLTTNFEVIGLIKSGVGAEIVVKYAMSDIVNLTKSDVVVFLGGSNDVGKNNFNTALKDILNFVKDNNNSNDLLLSVSCRHDVMDSSCVNSVN